MSIRADIRRAFADGKFHNIAELVYGRGYKPQSVKAALRILRRPENGWHKVQRRKLKGVTYYRVTKRPHNDDALRLDAKALAKEILTKVLGEMLAPRRG